MEGGGKILEGHLKKQNIILVSEGCLSFCERQAYPQTKEGRNGWQVKGHPFCRSFQPVPPCNLLGSAQRWPPHSRVVPGGAQVMLHAPLQTWPCGVLKEKADCTRRAD